MSLAMQIPGGVSTSAAGPFARRIAKPVVLASMLSALATTTTTAAEFENARRAAARDGTTAGPVDESSTREAGDAIAELRSLCGLTWEQLARLFNVSRRSLHFWASGKPATPANEERLQRLVAVMRKIDRGSGAATRAVLVTPLRDGRLPVDLLAEGRFDEVATLVGPGTPTPHIRRPRISEEARRARMPRPPGALVDALQDPVHIETGAVRPAKSVRVRSDP